MVHENSPYETVLKCRYTWTFELEPVLLGIELGHWGYEMGTSWAQVMLCSWNCIKSKVRKVPLLWELAPTRGNLRKFHDEWTLTHLHMHVLHQKPFPIDSAWWTASENTLFPSHGPHEDFWPENSKVKFVPEEISLELGIPSSKFPQLTYVPM